MKAFTYAAIAIAGASSVAAAAVEPAAATPAAYVKRQDDPAAGITGLLNPLSEYLTNPGIASFVESVATNSAFPAAVSAAATSDFAPFQELVSSLQADAEVSSVIYEALGTESADAFYASASDAVAQLATATATEDPAATTTDEASAEESASEAASSASEGASSVASSATDAATSVATSAPASGAYAAVQAGSVLPAVMVVFGVAAGAILL